LRAIIIGSGISGLTAATYLVKAGYRVTVYEQFPEIGGVTASVKEQGFTWELGQLVLEGFGHGEQVGSILSELNIADRIEIIPGDRVYAFPDFIIEKPEEYAGLFWRRERLKEIFPEEREGLDRYYTFYVRLMEIMTLARRSERAKGIAALLLKARMFAKLLPLLPKINWNAQRIMDFFFASKKLQGVFISILADFVVRPSQFIGLGVPAVNPEPAFDKRIPLQVSRVGYHPSYHFIRGGCSSLVAVLADEIRKGGGSIHTGALVEKILIEGGSAKGIVLADGSEDLADIVLVSGGAREVFYGLVGIEHLPGKFISLLKEIPLMESILMIHLGVDFDPAPYQRSAVTYYYGTYDIERGVDDLQAGRYHEGKDGFLIYIPSYHTPEMSPEGHYSVTVYTVAPNKLDDGTWEERRDELADALLEEAERVIPGLRKGAKVKIILTPDDFKKRTALNHHTFGGAAPVMGKSGVPHKTPIRGLWFIGAQSESGAGINNVMHGAWRTMKMILGDPAEAVRRNK